MKRSWRIEERYNERMCGSIDDTREKCFFCVDLWLRSFVANTEDE